MVITLENLQQLISGLNSTSDKDGSDDREQIDGMATGELADDTDGIGDAGGPSGSGGIADGGNAAGKPTGDGDSAGAGDGGVEPTEQTGDANADSDTDANRLRVIESALREAGFVVHQGRVGRFVPLEDLPAPKQQKSGKKIIKAPAPKTGAQLAKEALKKRSERGY